jgi:hypothetical protein
MQTYVCLCWSMFLLKHWKSILTFVWGVQIQQHWLSREVRIRKHISPDKRHGTFFCLPSPPYNASLQDFIKITYREHIYTRILVHQHYGMTVYESHVVNNTHYHYIIWGHVLVFFPRLIEAPLGFPPRSADGPWVTRVARRMTRNATVWSLSAL